jgi:predicted CxxxxCH...CXXCH cytochrome family protein
LFESGPSGSGPWTTVAGCAGVTGASPRVCIDVNVAESSTYYYQVTYIDDVDGVTGLNPRTTGPHLTPACAADDTTVVDNSAEANSCRQMTSSSFFDGDANGDGWTQVEYNTSATWPGIVACERATGPSPRQCVIPELTPGQSYWLRFTYNDLDGVTATAPPNPHQIGPIAVPACGTDEAAPTVLILSPRRDAVVGGTDRVKVQVYETNLSTVEWSVNSENDLDLAAASLNSNYACGTDCVVYEFDLVTTGLANDTHYLTIKATDVEGNFARVKHAFRVNNSDGKAAGDGLLLRRTRGSQLCIDCHNLPTHSSQSTSHDYGNWALDCLTCHTPHQTKNIYLIEDSVRTPNSGERSVDLRDLGGVADYGLAELSDASGGSNTLEPGVGLCETCHTRTKNSDDSPRYRNTGEGGNGHAEGACIVCHTHEVGFSGAGGACDNCHFAPPTVGKHGSHDQVGSVPSDYGTTTSHATATEYGFACSKCHTGGHINDNAPNHDGSMTWPWEVEVLFDDTADPMNPTGAYAGTYNENQDQGPDGDWWSWSDGSCSDLYCHSRAVPLGGTDAFATVSWDQVATLDCTSCHDTAGDTTTLSNLSPAHRIHTDTDRYDFRCVRCHVNTITVTTNDAIADKREHVDGEKDVFFDSSGVNNAGGSYDDVAYRCSDTYCHSNGQVQTPPYSSGPSIAWDSTATCRSCHGGDATGTPTMASGKHPNHVNNASFIGTNYDCITCHAATVSANETVNDFGNHVNGTSNVSGTNVGTWSDPTCTSSYCHSSGQAAPQYYTMNWGTDTIDDCKGCHGRYTPEDFTSIAGEPNYANGGAGAATANSHSKHVGAATDCTNCHNSTTTTGTEIINGATIHTDGTRDVDIAATWDTNGGAGNYDPTPGNKTCSGIKCHGPGTPQWGETIDLCLDCHDGPDGGSLGDGTPNGVGDEWATDGHGSSAGGSFTSTMGGCDYCHQLDAGHTPTASTNPYRLRFTPNDNSLCLRCHLSDSDPGINDNSETTALTPINSSKNVGTAHFGAKHQTGEGGELCWDCHDPHGVPTNILMVKDLVSQSSDQYGVPGATVTVTFTDNTTAGQAVGRFTEETNTPRQGICQACHDPTKPGTESTKYWRNDGTDDPDGQGGASPIDPSVHNAAKLCSDCHSHTDNFKGAGDDCLGCHQNDSQVGTFTRRAVGADFTKNSHHVGSGGTYMGGSLTNFDCAVCHLEGFVDTAADPDEVKTSDTGTAETPPGAPRHRRRWIRSASRATTATVRPI